VGTGIIAVADIETVPVMICSEERSGTCAAEVAVIATATTVASPPVFVQFTVSVRVPLGALIVVPPELSILVALMRARVCVTPENMNGTLSVPLLEAKVNVPVDPPFRLRVEVTV
jgi:hypothetical protein